MRMVEQRALRCRWTVPLVWNAKDSISIKHGIRLLADGYPIKAFPERFSKPSFHF